MLLQKNVKSVLNKHKKRDSWFLDDYSINPYEGCSCNCLYCYIRGSKYGVNMEEGLAVKANALEVLEKQLKLRVKKKQYGIVAVGSATDAYMNHEANYRMTEEILKLLLKYHFPVFISTKRTLITRDIPLLKQIDQSAILPADLKDKLKRGVILSISVSSMDENITNMLEPAAVKPLERLQLLKQLTHEGFLTGVNAIPILPFISDSEIEMEKIIASAKLHGAHYVLTGGLTLFGNEPASGKVLYYKFLEKYDKALIPEYDGLYNHQYFPPRLYLNKLKKRADRLCAKYEIRNSILQ